MLTTGENVSLYFHLPFCSKKCHYCHFYVVPNKELFQKKFIEALEIEWSARLPLIRGKRIESIYFGGGTPSLLRLDYLERIFSWIKGSFNLDQQVEVTIEANPEDLTKEKVRRFLDLGINRISLGLQTFNESSLVQLGREHSATKGSGAVDLCFQEGTRNISIDLMYDLPGQTLEDWKSSLKKAFALPITHLSLYNLTIEPHTSFFKRREKLQPTLPSEEVSTEMIDLAESMAEGSGFVQYEISAFAREGKESHHNRGYWKGRPFLGYGPSAFSYWEGERFRNVANLNRYHQTLLRGEEDGAVDYREELSDRARVSELLAVQLRLLEGVDLLRFQEERGALSDQLLSSIESCISDQLIKRSQHRLILTKRGRRFYDTVASELIECDDL